MQRASCIKKIMEKMKSFVWQPVVWLEDSFVSMVPTGIVVQFFCKPLAREPNPMLVVLLAIVFGLILGGVMFGVADFAIQSHPILLATLAGVVVGIILGVIVGLLRRGPVRGAIGQDLSKVNAPAKKPEQEARTVIAIRLHRS